MKPKHKQTINISFLELPGDENTSKRNMNHSEDNLIYAIYQTVITLTKRDGHPPNLFWFEKMLVHLERKLKLKGIDLKLPTMWYINGEQIEWETLKERLEKVGYTIKMEVEK
jgi:hypothetical protein